MYEVKRQQLCEIEKVAQSGQIDLYYADEAAFSQEGNVPYGWQFKDEKVSLPTCRAKTLHCMALLSRQCKCHFKLAEQAITADMVLELLDSFSFNLKKLTVVVLDNAAIHKTHKIKERLLFWQNRGLFLFFLPPYSPQLNIIEILWRHLKYHWIKPIDYKEWDSLRLAVYLAMNNVGTDIVINFKEFNS